MRLTIFIFIILFAIYGYSQEILIHDLKTGKPIENVVIHNREKSKLVQTDIEGKADVSAFNIDDLLIFQHPSYQQLTFSKSRIAELGYQIGLTEKIIKFDEVVISANKWEQNITEVPNKILAIQPKEISFYESQTSADVLKNSGQVFVQKSQLGGGSPMIRGFGANSVLLVVDGVRMNNAIYRSGNLQNIINIDPNLLDGAEVIFGPGSVIYGSDALGGVVDFHLKEPSFSNSDKQDASVASFIRYSSANNEITSHLQFNVGSQKLAFFGGITYSDYDDLETGNKRTAQFPDYGKRPEFVARINGIDSIIRNSNDNSQAPSGFYQYNMVGKLKYRPAQNLDVGYGFYFSSTSDIPRYDRLIEYSNGLPKSAEWYYGPQEWMMNRVRFSFFKANQFYDQAKITVSYQNYNESRNDRDYQNPNLRTRNEKVNIITINFDLDKVLRDDKQIFYGFEANYNKVESTAITTNIDTGLNNSASTRYPDGGSNYSFVAGYFSYKWNTGANSILSLGGRISYTHLYSEFIDTTFFNFPFNEVVLNNTSLNGNLGYVIKPSEKLKLDFLFSTGFRAPNVDDIGKVFDSEPGTVVVPNKNLGPENTYNFESTITGNLISNFQFSITGFYTFLDNAIVRRDFQFNNMDSIIYDGTLSKVQALVNTNQAYILGTSFQIKGEISPSLYFTSDLTFSTGEDKSGIPLRHTTPLFGKTVFGYTKNKLRVEVYFEYNGKRNFDDLPPSEQNKTHLYTADGSLAWYTFNIKSSYQFTRNIGLNLGIENILNHHYRPYSSGISAPGRNFIVSLKANIN